MDDKKCQLCGESGGKLVIGGFGNPSEDINKNELVLAHIDCARKFIEDVQAKERAKT